MDDQSTQQLIEKSAKIIMDFNQDLENIKKQLDEDVSNFKKEYIAKIEQMQAKLEDPEKMLEDAMKAAQVSFNIKALFNAFR